MNTVILEGGYGTRISEESILKPKPMIEIGSMPILWHIMKTYSLYGFNDFIISDNSPGIDPARLVTCSATSFNLYLI